MTGKPEVPLTIDTGERLIPDLHHGALVHAEHIVRYLFATALALDKRVADIASGAGYGSELLRRAGAVSVIGVDYSGETAEYATKRYAQAGVSFVTGDAESLPLASSSLDLVVSFETIEHLHNPASFLDEVQRVLAPGGMLAVSTPNRGVFPEGNPFHVHEFTMDELREEVEKRFEHRRYFLQNNWTISSVYTAETTGIEGDDLPPDSRITKLVGMAPESSLYVVCVCSESPLPDLSELAVMSGVYEVRGFQGEILRLSEEIERLRVVWGHVAEKDEDLKKLQAMVAEKDEHIEHLLEMVSEKDSHIVALQGMVGERDRSLAEVEKYSLARLTRGFKRLGKKREGQ
jgi:SAM-dependent methyltransferase